MAKNIQIGDQIRFLGYSSDTPEADQLLEKDAVYTVADLGDADNDFTISVLTPNPKFNAKKPESETNKRELLNEVFDEEFEVVEAAEAAEPARGSVLDKVVANSKAKKPGKVEAKPVEDKKPVAKPTLKGNGKATRETADTPAEAAPAKPGKLAAVPKLAPAAQQDEEDRWADLTSEQEDPEILGIVSETEDLLAYAQELAEQSSGMAYKLGGILLHVKREGEYQKLDAEYAKPGGFALYVSERLNIQYRTAQYFIDIYYKWNKFQLPVEKVAQIGWSKAKEIAAVMTDDTAEELLKHAEDLTVDDLKTEISTNYKKLGKDERSRVKRVTLKFSFDADTAQTIENTLRSVAAAMNYTDIKDALEQIVLEWAAEHPTKKPATSMKQAAPARAATKPAGRPAARTSA